MKNNVYITPQTTEYKIETISPMLGESPNGAFTPELPYTNPAPERVDIPGKFD